MNEKTRKAMVKRWRKVTESVDPETAACAGWADEPVGHFLHAFRPSGSRLAELFDGLPEFQPVQKRLQTVYDRAGRETGHMYFMVSKPLELPDSELIDMVRAHLNFVGDLALHWNSGLGGDEAAFLTRPDLPVEILPHPPPPRDPSDFHPLQGSVYETICELHGQIQWAHPVGQLLAEPLYMLACSYELAGWILTPLAADWRDEDPLSHAAKLWQAGVSIDYRGEAEELTVVAWRQVFEEIPA